MRAFVAVELPGAIRRRLASTGPAFAGDAWRRVRPENLHVTLRFLGEIDPASPLADGATWAAGFRDLESFSCEVNGLGCFPTRRRPRVAWAGLRDGPSPGGVAAFEALAAAADRVASAHGLSSETRPFRAHVTIARARPGGRARFPEVAPQSYGVFRVEAVSLFRSRLLPGGARYERLARVPFGDPSVEGGG